MTAETKDDNDLPRRKAGKLYPTSQGYLVVDNDKCCGCKTCMMVCSLAHEGTVDFAASRIQVAEDNFGRFPNDIEIQICKQCITPTCLPVCRSGALHIDVNGLRVIDEEKCNGCKLCISACSQVPNRIGWNERKKVATKCDLCTDAPYLSKPGGVDGGQACVLACPMKAIAMVKKTPKQRDGAGYDVNLRKVSWSDLMGFHKD
jgi:Fe-S-cluster-containing dehydrogenase component